MSRRFVEVFPLPWHIIDYQEGYIRAICPSEGDSVLYFGIFDDYDNYYVEHEIHDYIVNCANIVPEAKEILRSYLSRNDSCSEGTQASETDLKKLYDRMVEIVDG